MPWDEIIKRFTASEMAMMNFSAREQVADLGKDKPGRNLREQPSIEEFLAEGVANPDAVPPNEYTTTRGDAEMGEGDGMDMRKHKGKDVWAYFSRQGLPFPVISKPRSN